MMLNMQAIIHWGLDPLLLSVSPQVFPGSNGRIADSLHDEDFY